jgi:hypothetical protein
MSGLHIACFVAAGICWLGAVAALALPGRRAVRAAAELASAPCAAPVPVPVAAS